MALLFVQTSYVYYFLHFTLIHPSLLYGCGLIIEWRTGHTGRP
jgi:hypothetical protein